MKRFTRFLSTALCFSLLLPMTALLTPLNASPAISSGMREPSGFHALGGSWQFAEKIQSSGSGDVFALSEISATRFIYEADVTFQNRTGAASLVFLSGNDPARGSYIANIDIGAKNARIFRFEASGGATTKGEYKLSAEESSKNSFHLRVEVNENEMIYFLDGKPVVSLEDTLSKPGGYLGLLTFNTSVTYENLRYCILDGASYALTELKTPNETLFPSPVMKTRLAFGVKNAVFSVGFSGDTLSAAAFGGSATASVFGNEIAVSNISESFTLSIGVTAGDVTRHYLLSVTVENDPDSVYNEEWRPQLHWSPLVNFNNDPNGLVYDPSDQTYHMFFQYNPFGLSIGNQVWGHAVSTDLVHWKEVDIAIPQDHLGAVFSGSCVVDENNTSGFFTDNKPGESRLVALYTSDGGDTTYGHEKQCIAYSKDHGMTWIRPSLEKEGFENPILKNENNKYGRDFRDPKIFWYDGKWFMVVAGGRARLFTSPDLIHWTLVTDMGFDSECPDFYPLAVDGDETNVKWVYNASGRWYMIGRLEKVSDTNYRFIAETERIPYNGGGEVYATQSFYNDKSAKNRRIAISWLQDNTAHLLSGKTWNGAMTLPYEQSIRTVNGKLRLCSYPVSEVDLMRREALFSLTSPTVAEIDRTLSDHPGIAYDMTVTFTPKDNAVLTFTLRKGVSVETRVVYDAARRTLRVIRAKSSKVTGVPAGTMEMPLSPDENGTVTLRILMDTNVIEVFGNEGEAALCGMIFPGKDAVASSFALSGDCTIHKITAWSVGSVFHEDATVLPEAGIYFDLADDYIPLGDKTTVTANEIDETGRRTERAVALTLNQTENATAEINASTATLVGVKKGSVTLTASVGALKKTLTLSVADIGFHTNLQGWTSADDWYIDENGYSLAGANDNSFAFSSAKNKGSFLLKGTADLSRGGCLGLVFAASHPEKPINGYWYGANIDTHGAQPVMKLFFNNRGNEVWAERLTVDSSDGIYQLEVSYHGGVLSFTVNGYTVTREVKSLPSGALGLVSWNGGGSFDGVTYHALDEAGNVIDTPVTDLPETTEKTPQTTSPTVTDAPTTTDVPVTDTPVTEPEKPSEKKNPILPIVIGVGTPALVLAAGVAVYLFKKKKTK